MVRGPFSHYGEVASVFRPAEQVDQLFPPEFRPAMGAMPLRAFIFGDEDVPHGREAFCRGFGDFEAGGIDEIIGGVDPRHRHANMVEPGPWIIIAR